MATKYLLTALKKDRFDLIKRKFAFSLKEIKALTDLLLALEDYLAKKINPRELRDIIEVSSGKIRKNEFIICSICREEIEDLLYEVVDLDNPNSCQVLCLNCYEKGREPKK